VAGIAIRLYRQIDTRCDGRLGPQRFQGRVVILVHEHTASAGEMLAAFAQENGLTTITGAQTPERLLSGSAFKSGFGYMVGLPVAAYLNRDEMV
jgi:C-terminal processing protease CtpA/Prc